MRFAPGAEHFNRTLDHRSSHPPPPPPNQTTPSAPPGQEGTSKGKLELEIRNRICLEKIRTRIEVKRK